MQTNQSANDLWDAICAASAPTKPAKRPGRPAEQADEQRAKERALIEALCGEGANWRPDAQVFIVHHWTCVQCGETGQFPNIQRRLLRKHNTRGTSWIAEASTDSIDPCLPVEFLHHNHEVSWCTSCVRETDPSQRHFTLHLVDLHQWSTLETAGRRPRLFV